MKLADEVLAQAVHLAIGSNQFEKTLPEEWIKHFVYLSSRGHVETVVSPQGVLCGFITWLRVHKPATKPAVKLPDELDKGDYIQIILAVVHPLFVKKGERGLIRRMRDEILDKCIGAKFWTWVRSRDGKNRLAVHAIQERRSYEKVA